MATVKERTLEFIKSKGISMKSFEERCGLSTGYVTSMRKSFGEEKLNNVLNAFPELNRDWLLYGEGNMQQNKETLPETTKGSVDACAIPLLPTSAQAGSLNDFITSVRLHDCEMVVSPVKGADFAIPVTGESMAPEYPNGSQVHIKRINERAFIEWGKVYVLDTCNGTVIKRVVPSEQEGHMRCLSINPDPIYAPFEVAFADIYGIYRVLLCLSLK